MKSLVTNKYKTLLYEMDGAYRYIRSLIVDDNLIEKTRINIQKTMFLWRELKLTVTSSAHSLEDHILTQMSSIEGDIADKTEDHIEFSHQIGKRLERRYKGDTDFTQSYTSQIKLQYLLSNPIIEMK